MMKAQDRANVAAKADNVNDYPTVFKYRRMRNYGS